MVEVVGPVGRWQLEKAAIVFLISIPGLAHIFLTPFLMPATDFWCGDLVRGSQAFNDSKVGTAACSPPSLTSPDCSEQLQYRVQ